MKSTFATEMFVKLFGAMPKPRVPQRKPEPPTSAIMVPDRPATAGGKVIYHVVPRRKDDRWNVKKEGAAKPSSVCDTKDQAIEAARGFAQNLTWSQVIIHNKDGKVAQEFSYGAPPAGHEPDNAKAVGDWSRDPEDETEADPGIQDS